MLKQDDGPVPISVYINTPIPLFLKLFAMETGTIGCSGKLLCLPVRKGTVGHIEHNVISKWIDVCLFNVCFAPYLGAFVIYAFTLHILDDRRRAAL